MSRIVRITESDLRAAVADERYWRVGHPERGAFQNWVGQGFRGLNPSDGEARTTVWVRAYMRGGHWVSSHFRGTPGRYGHVLQHLNPPSVEGEITPTLVMRGPVRPRPTQTQRPLRPREERPPPRQEPIPRERITDDRNRDHTAELRDRSEWVGPFHPNGDQWRRPGGTLGREIDLMRLRPVGEAEIVGEGVLRYRLADGRIATLRASTSPGSEGVNTLEIAQPSQSRGPARFDQTDKFRYPSIPGSP